MILYKKLLFVCFLLTGCQNSLDFHPGFEQTTLFSSKQHIVDDVFFRYPFRIRLNDSLLYVMDLHTTDYYCHQFEYPSMKHRRSFARKGNGAGEFLDAENIRINSNGDCWLLDANNAKMTCFSANAVNSLENELKLDRQLIRTLDFDLYQDSLFIVPDYTGEHRFNIISPNGTIKERRGTIPVRKRGSDIPNVAYAQAWRGFLDHNQENGIMAIATQLGEVIEIYNLPENRLVNVIYGKQGEPEFHYRSGYAIPEGIMGYSDIYVGKENIYALFWGHTFKDITRGTVAIEGGNQIHVFDLEGNPVKQYILDRHITGFCMNEEEDIILGLDVNSDQPIVELRVQN
jgi:hypothetical protein